MDIKEDFSSALFSLTKKVRMSQRKSDSSFQGQTMVIQTDSPFRIPNSVIAEEMTVGVEHNPQYQFEHSEALNGFGDNDNDSIDENDEAMGNNTLEENIHNTSHETTDDDIYGDLESSVFAATAQPARRINKDDKETLHTAQKEVESLRSEVRKLTRENKAYATNISSLYLTAKNEIEKKNFIIKQLQSKLQRFTAQKKPISKEESEEILKNCQEANNEANSQIIVEEITKAIMQIKATAQSNLSTNRKQYKFGNMSLYFSREQISFKRGAKVQVGVTQTHSNVPQGANAPKTSVLRSDTSVLHPHEAQTSDKRQNKVVENGIHVTENKERREELRQPLQNENRHSTSSSENQKASERGRKGRRNPSSTRMEEFTSADKTNTEKERPSRHTDERPDRRYTSSSTRVRDDNPPRRPSSREGVRSRDEHRPSNSNNKRRYSDLDSSRSRNSRHDDSLASSRDSGSKRHRLDR